MRVLLADGYSPAELAGMRLEDVPSSEAKEKYLSRREELGLDVSEEAPFVMDPDGRQFRKRWSSSICGSPG